MTPLRIGYVPLTDAAVLVAAAERGFAKRHGLSITLEREPSWATLRDKLAIGHLDAAHMLAPLALAMSLGLGPGPRVPLVVPFVLSRNGNAITVSMALWREMGAPEGDLAAICAAFGRAGRERAASGRPLCLATVFPHSTHTHLLWRFLERSGLDPDRDVVTTVVPPPYAAKALMAGSVDGICVGAPWNSVAVAAGAGRIVALGPELIPDATEKVLAIVRGRMPDETVQALVAALKEAAAWCADEANQAVLADMLASPDRLGLDAGLILRSLQGRLVLEKGRGEIHEPAYLRLGEGVHRPDPEAAVSILHEMMRSGQVRPSPEAEAAVRAVFEPLSFDCI